MKRNLIPHCERLAQFGKKCPFPTCPSHCLDRLNETWQEVKSRHLLPRLWFLAHRSRRLEWAIVIAHRPSEVNFHIFDFYSETAERNSTKLHRKQISTPSTKFKFFRPIEKKQDGHPCLCLAETFSTSSLKPLNGIKKKTCRKQDLNALYQVCVFRADRKNNMAALASDWLRYFRLLLWNHRTEFNETWQKARSQRPLPSLYFSGRSKKQDGQPCLWLAETFSTSSLKPLNGIQQNLTESKISTPSTKFVFFRSIRKTRWLPRALIGWDIFDFPSESAEWSSMKLDSKQDLNILYQLWVLRADQKTR